MLLLVVMPTVIKLGVAFFIVKLRVVMLNVVAPLSAPVVWDL
jgi:hypothetical protein